MTNMIEQLHALAAAAGLHRKWRDVEGCDHIVPDSTLARILQALGYKTGTSRQVTASLKALNGKQQSLPALVIADAGGPIDLPFSCQNAQVTLPDGSTQLLECRHGVPLSPAEAGYYDCNFDGTDARLAVAPAHCPLPAEGGRRAWGASLQIPSLRSNRASAFGGFAELADAVKALANAGADAAAINPVHALFPGHGEGFSPYSPSSRRFLNTAMADPALLGMPPLPETEGGGLIDWKSAIPARQRHLRTLFESLSREEREKVIGEPDRDLVLHAVFNALDARFRPSGAKGWQDWPAQYRNPDSKSVADFAAKHAEEVEFHLFLHGMTELGLKEVQAIAKRSGMSIGLIGDLAVGVDPGGSDCWALGDVMLRGLTIGAPPDPLGPLGQNWNITTFSPEGLQRTGYASWIAMIRAALAHSGGLRIDHAFGLARLWVIPEGGGPGDGAYLTYPYADLIRLVTLEAHLAGSMVIAEDLGTAPHGFAEAIACHHMLGMRVLWFERAADQGFIGAQDYDALTAAMTGTHDTPTLAGWWSGRDLDWAERLGRLPDGVDRAKAEEIRDWDRGLLWSTLAGHVPRPSPEEPQAAVDAAVAHIARTPSALAIVPVEDILGLVEQPNLPGTTSEHPNWRRRLQAPLGDLLSSPTVQPRLRDLRAERSSG